MENSKLQAALLKFATEDVTLCETEGALAITDTKLGVISMSYDEATGIFTAFDNRTAEGHLMQAAKIQMIKWLADQYIVEEDAKKSIEADMTPEIVQIDLHTEKKGSFTFKKHHCSTADFYQALLNFECNNWEQLGETSYTVHQKFADDAITQVQEKGMNASAHLAAYFDDELAAEIQSLMS